MTDHCGMTAAATRYLISKGVRLMGIDAPTFDPPVWAIFERRQFWEAHFVMKDEDYWHIENLVDLSPLVPQGFKGPLSTNIDVQFEVRTKPGYWQSAQVSMVCIPAVMSSLHSIVSKMASL